MSNNGSNWKKWDLHVHTPASIVHDYSAGSDGKIWETYISELENLPDQIKVLGINDYWFIDGYEEVLKYKSQGRLKNIDLILPVIELRLRDFVGSSQLNKINYHLIFSNSLSPEQIQIQFLNRIDIVTNLEGIRKNYGGLSKTNLIQLGADVRRTTPATMKTQLPTSDLELGFNNFTVELSKINDLLKTEFFDGKYLRAIGKSEWDAFRWEASASDKKSIINDCQFIFTASPTIDKAQQAKVNLKLQGVNSNVIHSSDAHEFRANETTTSKILGHCFTWIKADSTFEGLKQVIYEPDSRIYIGETPPAGGIHKLQKVSLNFNENTKWENSNFCFNGEHEFYFSPYFTSIIGGRGSGKSTLLNLIAQKHGEQINGLKQIKFSGAQSFENAVTFEPASIANIEYLAQNTIEEFAKDSKKFTVAIFERINKISNGILSNFETELSKQLTNIDQLIKLHQEKCLLHQKISELKKQLNAYQSIIEAFNDPNYNNMKAELSLINNNLLVLKTSQQKYESLLVSLKHVTSMFKPIEEPSNGFDNKYNQLISDTTNLILAFENQSFKAETDQILELENNKTKILENIASFLKAKNLNDDNIQDVSSANETIDAIKAELQKKTIELLALQKTLNAFTFQDLKQLKEQYINAVNTELSKINAKFRSIQESNPNDVKLIKVRYRENMDLKNQILERLNKHIGLENKISSVRTTFIDYMFRISYGEILNCSSSKQYVEKIAKTCNTTTKAFEILNETFGNVLNFKILKLIIQQCELDFQTNKILEVLYDEKSLETSSFGQRCTAAIVVLLSLGNNPIIIDEPEAHLDSSLIANYLVELIKEQKQHRQIIFATHNANFVVNADAELVIKLDNVDGQSSHTSFTIENLDQRESLLKLEGGIAAFKKREQKYNI